MSSPASVEDILLAALEKASPAERTTYLDVACGADLDLRRRVEQLVEARGRAGGCPDSPAAGPATVEVEDRSTGVGPLSTAAGPVGDCIGPYKLLQKLGEGGMGTVYVAEQKHPVKRRVALKVIKPGMDSAQVIRRFEAERQALALMDHPCIARVFDAGTTETARPYFEMELVKGEPITRYCDSAHLPIRDRLELFGQLCAAIQHAHTKGIIHRDLKPSNVLVCLQDGKPAPKVIDFGVAKALHQKLTDRTMYTEIGQMVGTREYMSPEQAELSAMDIDTRADVYALGAMLYELLTGSTPLDRNRLRSATYSEVVRIIKEEEPPRPSARLTESPETLTSLAAQRRTEPPRLTQLVKGELDWIVMKCLEKDRSRRYETASALARDVQRYLTDEPVEACPPSAAYRVSKFWRRNRGCGKPGVDVNGLAVLGDGRLQPVRGCQGQAEVGVGRGKLGGEVKGLVVCSDGLFHKPLVQQRVPEVNPGRGAGRPQSHRGPVAAQCLVQRRPAWMSWIMQQGSQVEVNPEVLRVAAAGPPQQVHRIDA
jgi:serine/threonine protein kinase